MNIPEHTLWTRKDIARLLGPNVTEWMVKSNERRWGLSPARVRLKTRSVLYCQCKVMQALKLAGLL